MGKKERGGGGVSLSFIFAALLEEEEDPVPVHHSLEPPQ
jgi:hypothetical protein